jgi:hypothetical protein
MTDTPNTNPNGLIAFMYHWGARLMGMILIFGIILQVVQSISGGNGSMILMWSSIALIGLWAVPVISLMVAGAAWVTRDRRDWTGWMAIGIGMFLSSLWVLK